MLHILKSWNETVKTWSQIVPKTPSFDLTDTEILKMNIINSTTCISRGEGPKTEA